MIDEATAIAIARKRAKEKGWGLTEPLAVITRHRWFGRGILRFEIETNPAMRGTKARFVIDAATGEIIDEGYIPR
jgi:uncharacterized membrane protein YkoI